MVHYWFVKLDISWSFSSGWKIFDKKSCEIYLFYMQLELVPKTGGYLLLMQNASPDCLNSSQINIVRQKAVQKLTCFRTLITDAESIK